MPARVVISRLAAGLVIGGAGVAVVLALAVGSPSVRLVAGVVLVLSGILAAVAELLHFNQRTVRTWIDRGGVPAVRVRWRGARFRRADSDILLAPGYAGSNDQDDSNGGVQHDRANLARAIDRTRDAADRRDDADLAEALRSLAEAANRLAGTLDA